MKVGSISPNTGHHKGSRECNVLCRHDTGEQLSWPVACDRGSETGEVEQWAEPARRDITEGLKSSLPLSSLLFFPQAQPSPSAEAVPVHSSLASQCLSNSLCLSLAPGTVQLFGSKTKLLLFLFLHGTLGWPVQSSVSTLAPSFGASFCHSWLVLILQAGPSSALRHRQLPQEYPAVPLDMMLIFPPQHSSLALVIFTFPIFRE